MNVPIIISNGGFFYEKNIRIAQMTKELMKDKDITDIADLQSVLKEMLKNGVEVLLEAELDYEKYDKPL